MSTRDTPAQIGDLPPFGRPANSALLLTGVTTVADAAAYGRGALLALHGVGPKAIRLLAEECERRGIELRP